MPLQEHSTYSVAELILMKQFLLASVWYRQRQFIHIFVSGKEGPAC